jgi:putative chitinase
MNTSKLSTKIPLSVIAQLDDVITKFNITNPLRLAHFLAQCAHESGDFKLTTENLNYSADGLQKIFKKYFATPEIANQYARNPQKIANKVYASRMGNGDEASGDGFKFRGRGYIQLTGKTNYQEFGTSIGVDLVANPDLVATTYPLASAAFFFNKNGLWTTCDKGSSVDVINQVRKRVNGGLIGIDDVINKFKIYNDLLV